MRLPLIVLSAAGACATVGMVSGGVLGPYMRGKMLLERERRSRQIS